MRVCSVAVKAFIMVLFGAMSVHAADSQPGSGVRDSVAEKVKGKDGALMVLIPAGPSRWAAMMASPPNARNTQ